MTRARTTHEPHCAGAFRCYSRALMILALAGLLTACGGGGGGGTTTVSSSSPNIAVLAWDPVQDPNLGGYRIYYGTEPGIYLQPVGQGLYVDKVTTYAVTGLKSATTYYFAATANDTSNNESFFSNEVSQDIL